MLQQRIDLTVFAIISIFWTLICIWFFNPSHPDPQRREKNNLNIFSQFFVVEQGFITKAFKVSIRPFEAPQRAVKMKI